MACNLNLAAAARFIHWAPPSDLDGLFNSAKAKCDALGLKPGRRSAVTPDHQGGDPTFNVRGALHFIEGVEPITDADKPAPKDDDATKAFKERTLKAKQDQHDLLIRLYATLATRLNAAGYTPADPEPAPEAPPVPEKTPDPKPLA